MIPRSGASSTRSSSLSSSSACSRLDSSTTRCRTCGPEQDDRLRLPLEDVAGFDISSSRSFPMIAARATGKPFLVGLPNTLLVAFLGIVFATIWGFTIGIARLSSNLIISWLATIYIETIRNIPLLLQLFFWYFAVLKAMPAVRDSFVFFATSSSTSAGSSSRGRSSTSASSAVVVAFVVGIIAALLDPRLGAAGGSKRPASASRRAGSVSRRSCVLPVIAYFVSGTAVAFDLPVLDRLQLRGRRRTAAGIRGAGVRPDALHGDLHRRDRARRHPGGDQGQTEAAQSLGSRRATGCGWWSSRRPCG